MDIDLYIEILCEECQVFMKKASGTSILTYYCPNCQKKITLKKLEISYNGSE